MNGNRIDPETERFFRGMMWAALLSLPLWVLLWLAVRAML